MTPVAFLDASALYSATARSILMYLAIRGVFRAHWSAAVQDEWIAALLRSRPELGAERLERTRSLMDEHIPGAIVSGYEHRIDSLTLPDADDRHVLAAAIHVGASIVVTENLKDFPTEALAPHEIVAQDRDSFIYGLLTSSPGAAVAAFAADRARLRNPAMTPEEYLTSLPHAGLTKTVATLESFAEQL